MNGTERGLAACAALLELEREARRAESVLALQFVMVNRTRLLVAAEVMLFWNAASGKVEGAMGVSEVDPHAPFVRWAGGLCRERARERGGVVALCAGGDWDEAAPRQGMWAPLVAPDGVCVGGLLLLRTQPWGDGERELLERLVEAYAHAWRALPAMRSRRCSRRWSGSGWGWLIGVALLAAGFLPVSRTALAPASVAPRDPWVVAAPLEGVVESVAVAPNATVAVGDVLLRLEPSVIANRKEMARLAVETARAELFRARQLSFSDAEAKASMPLLEARIAEKSVEAEYAAALLERTEVRSPRRGIAIFADANAWRGRPVAVGERVMLIADPERVEMEIRLPVADFMTLPPGAPVRLFLHADPLHPLEGELTSASYDAETTPEGILAYRLTAVFSPVVTPPPRIGLKGTAKLYGERVTVFYYLFRRPWAALRQGVGF
ncbi:MAG: HlyD family efflux transporter periplasmic adaptor subunit [Magnetococcales bacterium]|nr:HlyD family efflux transporter periplasmic adaptor subunit [Magnetococcales bacterium]